MAISGSGGWTPSVRVFIYNRKLTLSGFIHNVPKSVTYPPEVAAQKFVENPDAIFYATVAEDGGTVRLAYLLEELGLVDNWKPPATT